MIFTLFLLCAFNVKNDCTDTGDGGTPLADADACLALQGNTPNAACEGTCTTWCQGGSAVLATCEASLACWNGTSKSVITNADACTAFAGNPTADPVVPGRPSCLATCTSWCQGGSAVLATCEASLPCWNGTSKSAITNADACTAFAGDPAADPVVPGRPKCEATCTTWCQGGSAVLATCEAKLPCWNGTSKAPIAGADSCNAFAGDPAADPVVPGRPGCLATCQPWCAGGSAVLATCEAKLPCWNGTSKTAIVDAASCTAIAGNPTADPVVPARPGCLATCQPWCAGANAVLATCEASLPCWNGTSKTEIADAASCAALAGNPSATPPVPGRPGCEVACLPWCAGGSAVLATCEASLPCWNGTSKTAIAGADSCTALAGNPSATPPVPGRPGCEKTCKPWCEGANAVLATCEASLPCWNGTTKTPIAGETACDKVIGDSSASPPVAGNPACSKSCETFCVGNAPVVAKCEKALPCWDGTGKKTAEGKAACTKYIATTPDTTCKTACDAYCATAPCDATHKPECGTQCTAWCEVEANSADALCTGEDSAFSFVVSLLLVLVALL